MHVCYLKYNIFVEWKAYTFMRTRDLTDYDKYVSYEQDVLIKLYE